jgi:hypothetical protein
MRNNEYELDEDSLTTEKKNEREKEKILDETFKKAKFLKEKKTINKRIVKSIKTVDRPFLKSGILLIIVAIIMLVFIEYSPWMYINQETDKGSTIHLVYRDFNQEEEINQTVLNLFQSPCNNCSNNSQNYIGLTLDDFTNSPKPITNGIIILMGLGIVFTVFLIIDKIRRFLDEIVCALHSLFSIAAIIVSLFILISSIKFIGTYLLIYHNWSFIEISGIKNANIVFLTPILLVFLTLAIIRGAIITFKINFREMENKFTIDKPEEPYSTYRYGIKFR